MTAKMDRRIMKSQKAIHRAFLDKLYEDGFESVTIKDITDKADLSRKTFYLHYNDKYDLLDKIVEKHLKELEEICDQKKDKGLIEGTIIWFRYFEDHKLFFASLFQGTSTVSFRNKLLNFIMEEVDKKLEASALPENIDRKIILKFLGTAVMGVLESYVLEDIDGDMETIAAQVGEMLKRNL
ncbi:TetR/AcrR family transcriptional regulator C-terminal domain-containing protein [Virgibacillus sp. 179-BFC.A HS]|uniref:TetR/AcrR family transcriptional regulator C-terminal domain-containing protein n=1 Tax=Tigheibacillus jepli TaxID=3035914 RepID=A0ABU5CEA7_9BACI|nr:TetR/AcrR family transcriptional regulator C-terminal domain-containing protein [Virgibacillus sp. 179-BFC.A HS]MDY0404670.1 TetR/AcrR family transcriptional regulator C-terminal domain-containing protein [Virgibacillus sp. 179-BFC.A HS]